MNFVFVPFVMNPNAAHALLLAVRCLSRPRRCATRERRVGMMKSILA